MTKTTGSLIAVLVLFALPLSGQARAESPLSAIDWLSQSIADPAAQQDQAALPMDEGAALEVISVAPLDAPSPDAVGLLPASRAGLPRTFWGATPANELAEKVRALPADSLPAVRDLAMRILLAELDPPITPGSHGALFLARVDKLLDFGALDQAMALIEALGADSPEVFRRWFDIALLLGQEDSACAAMLKLPGMAPTYPARIYCHARVGDWNAAALTLRGAEALGLISETETALLTHFLDPESHELLAAAPTRPSPLVWRMLEAIGEPVPTHMLPVAFAHADLRGTAGWRAQLEAAERLTRSGALTPNRLLGLYSERMPAASGGIWDRVAAVQRFEAALNSRDPGAVAMALERVWPRIVDAELEVPFAELYADRLAQLPLNGAAAQRSFALGLLASDYEKRALDHEPVSPLEAFLSGLARGRTEGLTVPSQWPAAAIDDAFGQPAPIPDRIAHDIESGALGSAVLWALNRLATGAAGDNRAVTDGLGVLRHLGLEDTARRTALQLMLLERRG